MVGVGGRGAVRAACGISGGRSCSGRAAQDVRRSMRFHVFGHAIYEKALEPYKGVTAKALIVDIAPELLDRADGAAARGARRAGRAAISRQPQALASTRSLSPLPILGIPGWEPANEREEYYDDASQFRPEARRAPRETPARSARRRGRSPPDGGGGRDPGSPRCATAGRPPSAGSCPASMSFWKGFRRVFGTDIATRLAAQAPKTAPITVPISTVTSCSVDARRAG